MPQIKDRVESTFSTGVDASTTSWPLSSAAAFPTPANGNYWVWAWDEATYPDPKDDPDAERVRVVNKVSNTLTVVRGEGGSTGKAHSSGDTVAILADEANLKCANRFDVTPFGGDLAGTADATAAVQKAINAARESGYPVYFPSGTLRIDGKLEDYTGSGSPKFGLTMIGDGPLSSILLDNNSSGPMLEFDTQFLQPTFKDIQFRQNVDKQAHSVLRLIDLRTTRAKFYSVFFHGNQKACRRFLEMQDIFEADFFSLEMKEIIKGICIGIRNDNVNGGNIRFHGLDSTTCRVGIWNRGTSTSNNILLSGAKFNYPLTADHKNLSAGASLATLTQGATTINIGAGHSNFNPNYNATYIGNKDHAEIIVIDTYDSGTGDAVLVWGLENNYSADASVELITGSFSFVGGPFSDSVALINCHLEGAPPIFHDTPCFSMVAPLMTALETDYFGGANTFNVYIMGKSAFGGTIISPRYATDRSDEKLVRTINAAGSGNAPNLCTVINPIRITGGSLSIPEQVGDYTGGSTTKGYFYIANNKVILHDAEIRRGSGGEIEVDKLKIVTSLDAAAGVVKVPVVTVADANYSMTATDHTVVLTSLSAPRTITLPTSPAIGRTVEIHDVTGLAGTHNITINRNGQNINGAGSNQTISTNNDGRRLVFISASFGWLTSVL